MNHKKVFLCMCLALCCALPAAAQMKMLSGTAISSPSVDYGRGANVAENVFDGAFETFYAS